MLKGEIARELLKLSRPNFLAVTTTIGLFAIVVLLFFRDIPPDTKDVLQLLIGAVIGQWVTMVQYDFGSSSGSAKKTDMLDVLTGTGDGMTKSTTKTEIKTETNATNEPKPEDVKKEPTP